MFNMHFDIESMNVLGAVKSGFLSWGLLAGAMGIIFVALLIMNALSRRSERKKREKESEDKADKS